MKLHADRPDFDGLLSPVDNRKVAQFERAFELAFWAVVLMVVAVAATLLSAAMRGLIVP